MKQHHLLNWSDHNYVGGKGVLIACDENQEWLLKWWWDHYCKKNSFPVAFFDFGMSKSARLWCEKKGEVISFSLPNDWIKEKAHISLDRIQSWEDVYEGNPFSKRKIWFYKPYSFLQAPFDQNVWIDLDCEVKKSIAPLFDYTEKGDGFAVVKLELEGTVVHNSGVLAFKRRSPVIEKWVKKVHTQNHEYLGDENILIETIYNEKLNVSYFPLIYNWPSLIDQSPDAAIVHHLSDPGKIQILKQL